MYKQKLKNAVHALELSMKTGNEDLAHHIDFLEGILKEIKEHNVNGTPITDDMTEETHGAKKMDTATNNGTNPAGVIPNQVVNVVDTTQTDDVVATLKGTGKEQAPGKFESTVPEAKGEILVENARGNTPVDPTIANEAKAIVANKALYEGEAAAKPVVTVGVNPTVKDATVAKSAVHDAKVAKEAKAVK